MPKSNKKSAKEPKLKRGGHTNTKFTGNNERDYYIINREKLWGLNHIFAIVILRYQIQQHAVAFHHLGNANWKTPFRETSSKEMSFRKTSSKETSLRKTKRNFLGPRDPNVARAGWEVSRGRRRSPFTRKVGTKAQEATRRRHRQGTQRHPQAGPQGVRRQAARQHAEIGPQFACIRQVQRQPLPHRRRRQGEDGLADCAQASGVRRRIARGGRLGPRRRESCLALRPSTSAKPNGPSATRLSPSTASGRPTTFR